MNATKISFLLLFVVSLCISSLKAQIVGTHSGATDPVSEGWTRIRPFTGVLTAAVPNDLGLGVDAWRINDTSNSDGIYGIQMSAAQLQAAALNDWKLSSVLRVVSGPTSSNPGDDNSIHVAVHFHERRYSMVFGKESSGLPWIGLASDSGLIFPTLSNVNANYNSYDLLFSQQTGNANLYVNGNLAYNGFGGVNDPDFNTGPNDRTSEFLFFGSTYSNGTGNSHYNFVQFEIVPEPSSLIIFLGMIATFSGPAFNRRSRFYRSANLQTIK